MSYSHQMTRTDDDKRRLRPPPYRRYKDFEELEPSEDSDLDDLFYTPNTSPRTSIASSLLMLPTARKPSRKSLRLSDAGDPTTPTGTRPVVVSTRTPSTGISHNRHAQNQRTLSTTSSLSSTSLEPHSVFSDYIGSVEQIHLLSSDDRRKGREGTKRTRHGSVTLKPSDIPSQPQSVKSTTTSRRKSSQGLTDGGDLNRDVKRPAPPSTTPNGSATAVKATTTSSASTSAPIGSPHVLASRKSSKTQNLAAVVSPKEKTKQDETEAPDKTKEKGKELDSLTLSSRMKDKGKEKEKAKPIPKHYGTSDDNVVISERLRGMINTSPKTTYTPSPTPHTFSAFAPLLSPSSTPLLAKMDGNGNGNINASNKSPLPPTGFFFPPPPLHSPNQQQFPQQQQPQQHKNPLNGSAATYTYAHRQTSKPSTVPTMNMAALLEEDEVDAEAESSAPTRKLRHTATTGSGQWIGKGKGKRKSYDSTSSRSDSSLHIHSTSPSRSNANSNSHPPPDSLHHSPSGLPSQLNANSNFHAPSYSNTMASRSQSHVEHSTSRNPPKTLSSEVSAMTLSTPGELPSKGTKGYTSLVLPRAPLPFGPHSTSIRTASTSGSGSQRKWFGSVGKEGRIDLTRSGIAQTTMASVEVVRGLGGQQGQNGFGGKLLGMLRKRSISGGNVGPRLIEGLDDNAKNQVKEDSPTSKGKAPTTAGVTSTVLGFTSYRKPPSYVPGNSVLVQVWAVGVDGIDGRLVGVKFGDHIWRERGVVGGGNGYKDDDEVETEWEREGEQVDISKSTPQQNFRGLSGLGRSFTLRMPRTRQQDHGEPQATHQPTRSFSLKRNNTDRPQLQKRQKVLENKQKPYSTPRAEIGYIPGRSFVGRVIECGWDVRDEIVRKGDWVVGLLDIKKCGALTQFIVVDRHRIHRVPHPRKVPPQGDDHSNKAEASMPFQEDDINMSALTLEQLALLPLCGIPAYRAVRTFIYAFSSLREGGNMPTATANDRKGGIEFGGTNSSKLTMEHPQDPRPRVLVLRGHDGVGAMAVQMLAKRGWRVSVHVPFSSSFVYDPTTTTEAAEYDSFPRDIQERAKGWGADEIIFDEEAGDGIDDGRIAAIRVIESLREDGDVFDAILDTVGGKEVREAGERLLRSAKALPPTPGTANEPMSPKPSNKAKGLGQFTTLVGDVPERPIPTAGDNFRAGLRSLRFGSSDGGAGGASAGNGDEGTVDMKANRVGYAWVSVVQDVDWEGEDIGVTLGSVLRLALEDAVRPAVWEGVANHRVVPFEKAPDVFVDRGPLAHGRTVVITVV